MINPEFVVLEMYCSLKDLSPKQYWRRNAMYAMMEMSLTALIEANFLRRRALLN